MRMKSAAVAALALALPTLAAEPYEGAWAAKVAWCGHSSSQTDEVPITISSKGLEGYEYGCSFASVNKLGNAWIATMVCGAEGENWVETMRMTVSGNTLTLKADGKRGVKFIRCK